MTRYQILKVTKIALFGVLCFTMQAYGVTAYYVSSLGSDANDGKSTTTPWKTITKVNAVTFVSGDVVSFRAGDLFYGQINVNQSGVTLGSYGSGEKPVISGGIQLTGWSVHSGSIYKTKASAVVKNLFANSAQMTLARYPNTGFVKVATTNSSTTITSTGITQASGYWTGGNIRIRTQEYEYETHPVTSYDGMTLTLGGTSGYSDPYKVGYCFYLDNKLAALDAAGEWYCNPADSMVYFYAPGGINPGTLTVTGSVLDYGIASSKGSLTIQNLSIQFQTAAAMHFTGGGSNMMILSNTIYGQWMHGIEFLGSPSGCTISGNTIQNVNGRGINAQDLSWASGSGPRSFTITNNTIKSIGLIPGYGVSGFQCMTGIFSFGGNHNTIKENTIDSVGYCGIRYDGSYNLIENNIVTNTMLRLADGGAIYAYGNDGLTFGSTVRNNIIENVPGDVSSTPASDPQGRGIYFDNGCFNMVAEGNTVIRARSAGIFIQLGDYGITVRGNILYKGTANAITVLQKNTLNYGQNVITSNILLPLNNSQPFFFMQQFSSWTSIVPMGRVDSNYYVNPYNNQNLFYICYYDGAWHWPTMALTEWKSRIGQDAHSIEFTGSVVESLFVNRTSSPVTMSLPSYWYHDVQGNKVSASITLPAYTSRLLFRDSVYTTPAPTDYFLDQNYPNPFTTKTTIRFGLPKDVYVTLKAVDINGTEIETILEGMQTSGIHVVEWIPRITVAGVYRYRLSAGTYSKARRFVIVE